MRYLLLFLFLFASNYSFAQDLSNEELLEINQQRHHYHHRGMITLTSWAVVNIGSGTAGYFIADDPEWKRFYEMNVFWNTVNLGLGIAGWASQAKQRPDASWSLEKSLKEQRKTERVFLINTGLDVLYMGGGLAMSLAAQPGGNNRDLLKGYGHSLILQGGFLFVFDGVEYLLNRRNGWRLREAAGQLSVRPYGAGVSISYQFP